MLAPVSVTYSPKRSPRENLSPGFSHLLSKNENTVTRYQFCEHNCVLIIVIAAVCICSLKMDIKLNFSFFKVWQEKSRLISHL